MSLPPPKLPPPPKPKGLLAGLRSRRVWLPILCVLGFLLVVAATWWFTRSWLASLVVVVAVVMMVMMHHRSPAWARAASTSDITCSSSSE